MLRLATIRMEKRPGHDTSSQHHDFSYQMPMLSQSVVATAVSALLDVAVLKGAPRRLLMDRAGLTENILADPDARVPFVCFVELMKAGQELTGDRALALHFGETVDISEIAVGCVAAGMNSTFEDIFGAMNRYARLGVDVPTSDGGDRIALERGEGRLWVVDRRANPNVFPELTESTFARIVCSTRRSRGDVAPFQAVSFTHPAPSYKKEYERIFQVPLIFGAKRNAIAIDDRVLALRRRSPVPPPIARAVRIRAEVLLRDLDAAKTFRGRIEDLLASALPVGEANVIMIANRLAVSRYTLLRRLKAEGVTFTEVLEGLRRRLAPQLLEGGATVKQTAHRLGYSDPASFSRAFKRWTGSAPSRLP
jgi:AraC-like DNA-binding protein